MPTLQRERLHFMSPSGKLF